jgi:flagellar assembly protein FliH
MSARFTFDRTFPETAERFIPIEEKEPTLTISEHKKLMDLAIANARSEGFIEGQTTAQDEETARLARAMESVSMAFDQARHELDGIHASASAEALRFAFAFATRLVGTLVERQPLAPIEEAALRIFDDLRGAPHVAVRVTPELVEPTRDRLQAIARDRGYEGRLIILGEPEILPGDVRIEWADGGIVRDGAAAAQVLSLAVEQALAIHSAAPHAPTMQAPTIHAAS